MGKKLIFGVGINDADYAVKPVVDGVIIRCPFYCKWINMLQRCYSKKYQERQKTYIGCSVCDEWLTFSNFKQWMETQDWKGKQLDKDLLKESNKNYSPDVCVFVDAATNTILTNCGRDMRGMPTGVKKNKKGYQARCSSSGKDVYLGTYDTKERAHKEYLKHKSLIILKCGLSQKDDRVKMALIRRASRMVDVYQTVI